MTHAESGKAVRILIISVATAVALTALYGASDSLAAEASSEDFALEDSVLGAGGGKMSSEDFTLEGVIGQVVSNGNAVSEDFAVSGGFFNDRDLDSDNVLGPDDACPVESASCWDLDLDGCIDVPDPDDDSDGVSRGSCDCDDLDNQVWATPGEVSNLEWIDDQMAGLQFLRWEAPAAMGANSLVYDTIRTGDPIDFLLAASCVESSDGSDLEAQDPGIPVPGAVFYYLVRAENGCPLGSGSIGSWSNLVLRAGRTCP